MNNGKLRVFASLTNYWDELRLYHRDEKGQIPNESGNLQDATRCLVVSGISLMRKKRQPQPEIIRTCAGMTRVGWRPKLNGLSRGVVEAPIGGLLGTLSFVETCRTAGHPRVGEQQAALYRR